MCRDPGGGLGVEILQRTGVTAGMICGLRGHGIDQVLLDLARPQIPFGDAAGDAAAVAGAVIGHYVGLADHPGGLDRHQLGVAGSESDAEKCSPPAHLMLAAIALTAAAAIALPPRRPRTIKYDIPRGRSISSCLDCAEPTKPTGPPSTATGAETPSSTSSNSRNRAVGAFPIASTAPARRSGHSSIPAAERVVCRRTASDTISLPGRRSEVIPAATMDESHSTGAPSQSAAPARATTSSL